LLWWILSGLWFVELYPGIGCLDLGTTATACGWIYPVSAWFSLLLSSRFPIPQTQQTLKRKKKFLDNRFRLFPRNGPAVTSPTRKSRTSSRNTASSRRRWYTKTRPGACSRTCCTTDRLRVVITVFRITYSVLAPLFNNADVVVL